MFCRARFHQPIPVRCLISLAKVRLRTGGAGSPLRNGPERRRTWRVGLICSLFLAAIGQLPGATTISVTGRQILLNGQPLLLRGIDYQPTPIGESASAAAPFGDYYSSIYRAIYDRDFPMLRQMGANVVRVYSWDYTRSHLDFLDKAYHGGAQPIYVLVNRWIDPASDWSKASVIDTIKNDYVAMVTNVNNHPAVLGFLIGNELNRGGNGTNATFWSAVNAIAGAVKARAPSRLVAIPLAEGVSQIATANALVPNVDAWCLQIYRGTSFGGLFTAYEAASTKPMVITEFGIDAYDQRIGQLFPNNAQIVADTFQTLWQEILAHHPVVSGGCVFSYADEWWKSTGSAAAHDTNGFANALFPDHFVNEEWWGIFGVQNNGANPDLLQPRALFAKIQDLWTVPGQALVPANAGGRLSATFIRRADRRDLNYDLEGIGLTNWSPIARSTQGGPATNVNGGAFSIAETGSGSARTVTVVNASLASNAPVRFNRLKTTRD